ncbi:Phosphoglucomutase-2-like [Oopsacas minuta]|uniref:Phosphoglucomutase-2-like n=1 Tax=Oopsacas minuta TaxID=111878 RepID=A0AAV7KLT9_9METZ|nr:Phosphoglucomutase-2-like [Oopsacas minuta]
MEFQARVEEWLRYDRNKVTRKEVTEIWEEGNSVELRNRFGKRMSFGTAGLRATMGAGYTRINDLTVIQTTQGLAVYLIETFGKKEVVERGVVVGFDTRHNSERFAQLVAAVLIGKDIPVSLFSHYVPTPYTAYAVKKLKAIAGVMITASHNPKEDNGYKLYWCNAAQILSPHDKAISEAIVANLEPWSWSWDTSSIPTSPLISDPYADISRAYNTELASIGSHFITNRSIPPEVVYTPMHGVGTLFVQLAMTAMSLPLFTLVPEQSEPDPDFPTVNFPNPEEGKAALDIATKTADEKGIPLILANDPDADRLAVAEKEPGEAWHVFSGNDLGALFAWWALKNYRHNNKTDLSNVYMVSTAVSSQIIRSMALKEGFKFEETLTGFKWMGNKYLELTAAGNDVIFVYEEAIGFMYGGIVYDKDGISASVVIREMAAWLYEKESTLSQQLQEIYDTYGYHLSRTSYFLCYQPETIIKIFTRLRKDGEYPKTCGSYKVLNVRDVTVGYDSSRGDKKCIHPLTPKSEMITFYLENNCTITLRTSGTEPKIKYYGEIIKEPGIGTKDKLIEILLETLNFCTEDFLQPKANNLIHQEK